MTKYEKISVLAKETARSIGENKESWMNYLDVASRLYKYPFEDQEVPHRSYVSRC